MKRTKRITITKVNTDQALNLFSSDSYLTVNKTLLISYGPDVAVFICNLVDKFKYFKLHHQLIEGEWFFLTHETQMNQTGLTETKIRKCKSVLKHYGVIQTRMIGTPAKEHYNLHIDNLLNMLSFSPKKTVGLALSKHAGLYKETKYNNTKEKIQKKKKLNTYQRFLSRFQAQWKRNIHFQKALREFVRHRREMNKPLTATAQKRMVNKLRAFPMEVCIEAFSKSVINGWSGVFPESIQIKQSYTKPKTNISPKHLIRKHFENSYSSDIFIRYYNEARELLTDRSNGQEVQLAQTLLTSHDQIDKDEKVKKDSSAGSILSDYILWLESQGWISYIEPKVFEYKGNLFQRFIKQSQ